MIKWISKNISKKLYTKDKSILVSILSFSLLVFLVILMHIFFGTLYIINHAYELAFMNYSACSLSVFVLYLVANKNNLLLASYLTIISIIYYVLYCSYFLGYSINAVVLLPIVVICVYNIYEFENKHLFISALLIILTYLVLLYFRFNIEPKYDKAETSFLYIEIANVLIAFFFSFFVLYTKQLSSLYLQDKISNLSTQANIDFLTGLWNRRYTISEVKQQSIYNNYHLVLVDIDYFKKINDTYTHDAGDFVLSNISKIFVDYFNKEDLICRWGGEEFLFILQNLNEDEVTEKIEKLRFEISKTPFIYEQKIIWLTLSFGIDHNTANSSFEVTVKNADEALYFSKHNGRNKITFFKDINK